MANHIKRITQKRLGAWTKYELVPATVNINYGAMKDWRVVRAEDASGEVCECMLIPMTKNGIRQKDDAVGIAYEQTLIACSPTDFNNIFEVNSSCRYGLKVRLPEYPVDNDDLVPGERCLEGRQGNLNFKHHSIVRRRQWVESKKTKMENVRRVENPDRLQWRLEKNAKEKEYLESKLAETQNPDVPEQ